MIAGPYLEQGADWWCLSIGATGGKNLVSTSFKACMGKAKSDHCNTKLLYLQEGNIDNIGQ